MWMEFLLDTKINTLSNSKLFCVLLFFQTKKGYIRESTKLIIVINSRDIRDNSLVLIYICIIRLRNFLLHIYAYKTRDKINNKKSNKSKTRKKFDIFRSSPESSLLS